MDFEHPLHQKGVGGGVLWYILIYLNSEWVPTANFDLFEIWEEGSPVLEFKPWTSWLEGEHANHWAKVSSHTGLYSILHLNILHYPSKQRGLKPRPIPGFWYPSGWNLSSIGNSGWTVP